MNTYYTGVQALYRCTLILQVYMRCTGLESLYSCRVIVQVYSHCTGVQSFKNVYRHNAGVKSLYGMMHSNVDPHRVIVIACVHSRTATARGHGLRQQSLCSLIPPCPANRQIRCGAGQVSAKHVVSEAVQLDGSAARWR